jgi:hypothetical protein
MTPQLARLQANGGPDACFDQIAAYTWLNDPVTKSQLHVAPALTWILCSNNITYTSTQSDESKVIYPTLVEKANYKVLVYNGEGRRCHRCVVLNDSFSSREAHSSARALYSCRRG